jgi:hypothetical protein
MRSTPASTATPVLIGKVSDRKGARQHLDVAGRAHCGAGRGVIAAATRWEVDATVVTDTVCRRCLKALRAALAAAAAVHTAAADAAYYLTPPAQAAARDAELAADLFAFHTRRQAEAAAPAPAWNHRELLLAELAAMPVPAGFESYAA